MLVNRLHARQAGSYLAAAAVSLGLLFAAPHIANAAPTPPPNPTDGQLQSAAAQKQALAAEVGQLGGELARSEARLQQLQGNVELAEQKVAYAIDESRKAEAAKRKADAVYRAATKTKTDARTEFARYVEAAYIDGRPAGMTGTLLSATDPNSLLQESSFEQYAIENKSGAVGRFQQAQVVQLNAGSKARKAALLAKQRKADALVAQQQAADAYDAQQSQSAAIQSSIDQTQNELDAKAVELDRLQGQRATHDAFVKEQARLAAIRLAKKREAERQARIKAQIEQEKRQAALERARERARQKRNNSGNNSGGSSSGNGGGSSYTPPPVYSPPAPGNGGWTQAKADRAFQRARSTLGTPYAWAGGGPGGPSYGACVPSAGAPYDCHVRGYDCSGLVMYGWARGWDHYAATQYSQAGSYHPGIGSLRKGDLLFYSGDGTVGGIHHVAMYAGGGQIIEAPYSGGYVRYASMYGPGPIFGATRPLT